MTELLVGADVGGSSTRVAAATLQGQVLATAEDVGGNPNAVGLAASADRIRRTTQRCLAGLEGRVQSMVVGLAGGSAAAMDATFRAALVPPALSVHPRLVGDLEVAFAAGTPASEGCVLVAGTGAIAGRVHDGRVVERRDGWGWLLGDEGAGFWLGREAVRSTLSTLQAGDPPGPLHRAVLNAAGADSADTLVRRCYDSPPVWLATLAVLVAEHAGDPAAQQIAVTAADKLVTLLESLTPVPGRPLVLAGSVITRAGPVRSAVADRLRERYPNPVVEAANGLVGALWLAARSVGADRPDVHRRLVTSLATALTDDATDDATSGHLV